MKTVRIAELKNRLSHYLREVQRGHPILIADRDRIIARIERVPHGSPASDTEAEWLERLERRGTLRRGAGRLSRQWLRRAPRIRADVVKALLQERDESP